MKSVVILISGRGSNMESLLNAVAAGSLNVRVAAVLSNRPDAQGLQTAVAMGIPIRVVDHQEFSGRDRRHPSFGPAFAPGPEWSRHGSRR